jgi:hypothetical protein
MPPAPAEPHAARSRAEVNAEIRALLVRTGGLPEGEDREEYLRLRAEWIQAA